MSSSLVDEVFPTGDGPDGKTTKKTKNLRRNLVRRARAAARRTPTCHPERKMVGSTGLCHECYLGSSARELGVKEALALVEKHGDPAVVEQLRKTALALLQENLPEYARIHMEGAKMAALKGDTKPAEWALTAIKSSKAGPVLDPPQKAPSEGGVKVIVGVHLGGIPNEGGASKVIDVQPRSVPTD